MSYYKIIHKTMASKSGIARVSNIEGLTGYVGLPVHGQGVFVFSVGEPTDIQIFNSDRSVGLDIYITKKHVTGMLRQMSMETPIIELIDPTNRTGLTTAPGAYYWISLDSQNKQLIVGVGEPRMETKVYFYKFSKENVNLEDFTTVHFKKCVSPMRMLRDPIKNNVPLLVKDTARLTMDDVVNSI